MTKKPSARYLLLMLDDGRFIMNCQTTRSCATAIGYHSILIVVGGNIKVKGKWTVISTVELLDTTNGCWYSCDHLPTPHSQLQPAVVNNILYLLSGFNKGSASSLQGFSASLETLSTHRLKWKSLTDTPWIFSCPVGLFNKFLLAVGGRHPSDSLVKYMLSTHQLVYGN